MPICPDGIFEISSVIMDEDFLSAKTRSEAMARNIAKLIDTMLNNKLAHDTKTKAFTLTWEPPNETQAVIDMAVALVKSAYIAVGWRSVSFASSCNEGCYCQYRIRLVRA